MLLEGEKRVGDTAYEGSLRVARLLDNSAGAGSWVRAGPDGVPYVVAREFSRGAEQTYKATGAVETPVLGGKLRLNASLLIDPYGGHQTETLSPPPGSEADRYTQIQDSAEFGLRYRRALRPGLDLETILLQRLGWQTTTDRFLGNPLTSTLTGDGLSGDFRLRRSSGESIARTSATIQASAGLSLEAGVEGDINWLRTHTHYVADGVVTPLPAANVSVQELRGEAYATATWEALPTLTAEIGVRSEASRISSQGDVISGRSLIYPKPRLALTFSPDSADQFRLRLEREVGQLDFEDFTAQTAGLNTGTVHAGNPTLNPEQNWVIEAAWERRFWKAADITVTLRHIWLGDVVDRVGVPSPSGTYDAPGNIGSGIKDEVAFSLTLPTDRLGLKRGLLTGEATVRQSRVIDPTTGLVRSVSGLRQSDWAIHFSQGLPRWKASWGADIIGPSIQTFYRFDEIDTDKLKPFVTLFAAYEPRRDLTFRIEALNPTGQGAEHSRQLFNGPRNLEGLAFADVHAIRTGHFVRVRVIKSFP